jgi:outer membrane protein
MKRFLIVTLIAGLAMPAMSFAQAPLKVGTVDMQRAFKEYYKTKDAESKVNDAKTAAKKEFEDRTDGYKKSLEDINKINQQLDSPALSSEAKSKMARDRDEKIAAIKNLEREISDFRQTREQQLQQQAMRMREGIVKEITEVVMDKVKANGMDLVLDKSGLSTNYVPIVLFSRDSSDFTTDIITALNSKKSSDKAAEKSADKAEKTAEKPAASPKAAAKP